MQNVVERMDRLRTLFLKIFTAIFAIMMGFWVFCQLALSLLRPKLRLDFGIEWKRYFDFFSSIRSAINVSSYVALAVIAISLAVWFLYKKKLARNQAINTAVRDERVRFIWLLSFRRTAAAVIMLQFALWIFQGITPLFFGRYLINDGSYFFFTLYVLVITSLGTFLALDSRRTEITIARLTSFEVAVIRKAPALLGLYLGWHVLYIIGTIYRNWRFLKLIHANDYPRIQHTLDTVRASWIAWIVLLIIPAYFILYRSPKISLPSVDIELREDERVQMNWLKACRFSFQFVLLLLLVSPFLSIAFYTISHFVWNDIPPAKLMASLLDWGYIFSNLKIVLLVATVTLLGSYLRFDRKD